MSNQLQSQANLSHQNGQADISNLLQQLTISRCEPFVLSGCSGAGKGTLVKYLLEKYPEFFELSVSYTTRKPRQGEQHGREYYFVNTDEFQSLADQGVFVEFGKIYGNYYGTHKGEVEKIIKKRKICVLQIDLKAAQKIYATNPEYHFLFINVPEFELLRQRMIKRGTETEEVIERRMAHSRNQLEKIKELSFYEHIVNEELEQTKIDLISFINRRYQKNLVP